MNTTLLAIGILMITVPMILWGLYLLYLLACWVFAEIKDASTSREKEKIAAMLCAASVVLGFVALLVSLILEQNSSIPQL